MNRKYALIAFLNHGLQPSPRATSCGHSSYVHICRRAAVLISRKDLSPRESSGAQLRGSQSRGCECESQGVANSQGM